MVCIKLTKHSAIGAICNSYLSSEQLIVLYNIRFQIDIAKHLAIQRKVARKLSISISIRRSLFHVMTSIQCLPTHTANQSINLRTPHKPSQYIHLPHHIPLNLPIYAPIIFQFAPSLLNMRLKLINLTYEVLKSVLCESE